jgi:arylsulfatase
MEGIVMSRSLHLIGASVALGLAALIAPAAAQDKKPNILVIWGDDVGQSNISAYTKGVVG